MPSTSSLITASTRISRRADLLASGLRGETVMLDVQQGRYFGLDDIGSDIWALLESPLSVGELCEQLVATYDVDAEICQRDVLALLEELREAGLLQIHD